MIGTHGRHLLVEYMGCNPSTLNSLDRIKSLMKAAAKAANTTIVTSTFKPFDPQGVSGVVVIEESHLSIHTWPEVGYAAVDFYTCGKGEPEKAHEVLLMGLEATEHELIRVERGRIEESTRMQVDLWERTLPEEWASLIRTSGSTSA